MYIAFYFKGYYLIRFSELAPLFPSFDSLSACLLYEIVPANPNASLADRNKENGSKKDFFFFSCSFLSEGNHFFASLCDLTEMVVAAGLSTKF